MGCYLHLQDLLKVVDVSILLHEFPVAGDEFLGLFVGGHDHLHNKLRLLHPLADEAGVPGNPTVSHIPTSLIELWNLRIKDTSRLVSLWRLK